MKELLRGLYAIADAGVITPESLSAKVEQALSGGARLVQYRDKNAAATDKERRARVLVTLCQSHGIPLIVNDDPRLARAVGAQGVHLGKHDMDLAATRAMLGPDAIIGASCYNDLSLARAVQDAGADYVAFGSFFDSPTKPGAVRAELGLLKEARKRLNIPICAIGGITVENAASLIELGADMIAMSSGLFTTTDVKTAAQQLEALYDNNSLSPRGGTG